MKTLDSYKNSELALQIMKNIGRSIWHSSLLWPFRRRWNSSKKFQNRVIGWSLAIIILLLMWFIIIPIMTWITDFVNYVYWGITPTNI